MNGKMEVSAFQIKGACSYFQMADIQEMLAAKPVFRRSTRKFPAFLFSLFSFLLPPLDFSLIYNRFLMPFRGFFYWKNFFDML